MMGALDLEAMQTFAAVVRHRSFTLAAEALGCSPSTASRHVARLEDALEIQLLYRTTREVTPTHAGALYARRCDRMVEEARQAQLELAAAADAPSGVLRVTTPPLFGDLYLGPVLVDYARRYPRVEVELVVSAAREALVEQGFDLAIRVGALADSRLVGRRLGQADSCCVASPALVEELGHLAHPDRLHRAPVVLTRVAPDETWPFTGPDGPIEVRVTGRLRLNSVSLAVDAARAGLGLVRAPRFVVVEALRTGALVEVLPEWRAGGSPLWALYPADRHPAPKVRAFLDLLTERYLPDPPWQAA